MKQGFGSLELREGPALSNILHPSPRSHNLPSQLQWKKILLIKHKAFLWFCVRNQFTQPEVPYSGKLLLVQNFTEMPPDHQDFRGTWVVYDQATPLPNDCHASSLTRANLAPPKSVTFKSTLTTTKQRAKFLQSLPSYLVEAVVRGFHIYKN